MIPIPVPFPPGAVNCLALREVDGWTLIDTGLRGDEAQSLWAKLIEGPLEKRPIRRLIATHHHPDHLGLAGWFQRAHGVELWTSRTAWLFARMLQLDAWTEPPHEAETFMRRAGYDHDMMERYRKRAARNYSVTVEPLPLGFHAVAEGDLLEAGGRRWRVVFGHGHAPDHLVLISEDDDLVIAGDQILPTITPNIGVYPTEPDADPLGDWIDSCHAFAERLDDSRLILPGHGDPFRGARRRLLDVAAKHQRALDRLVEHLETPRTLVECFPVLYRREITPALEGLATVEAAAHLNRLTRSGRALRRKRPQAPDLWEAAQIGGR
ncbi:MAG: MBL fold metallo-hydrolase [Rhodobacteraceae bacterium]|nr:MBL fold metallo-hydrolase [Paracoccaceae bacterium]